VRTHTHHTRTHCWHAAVQVVTTHDHRRENVAKVAGATTRGLLMFSV